MNLARHACIFFVIQPQPNTAIDGAQVLSYVRRPRIVVGLLALPWLLKYNIYKILQRKERKEREVEATLSLW